MKDACQDAENTSEFRIKVFQSELNELKFLFCLFNALANHMERFFESTIYPVETIVFNRKVGIQK